MNIDEYTQKEFESIIKRYGRKHIIGVFLTGKVNYGFSKEVEDLKYITIYVPSFKDILDGHYIEDEKLLDLRKLYFLNKGVFLELLFSNSYIINPQFKSVFTNYFIKNREEIGHYCEKVRLQQAYERAEIAFEKGDYFEGSRLCIAAEIFASGAKLEDCFHIKNLVLKNYLIKADKFGLSDEEAEGLINTIKKYSEEASDEISMEINKLMKSGIIELFRIAFNDNITEEAFEDYLTKTEKEGYHFILKSLPQKKGCLSISKLIEDSSISRPVFKSLLNKMETKGVAIIENRGAKGTYIELV